MAEALAFWEITYDDIDEVAALVADAFIGCLGLFDACGKCGDRRLDGGVCEVGVANDDRGGAGAESLQGDAPRARRGEHRLLGEAVGEVQHDVQTGGGAVDGDLGELGGERGQQFVALAPVSSALAAQVTVELSALDQIGQRELSEWCRHSSAHSLAVGDWLHKVRWECQPAKANRWGQCLARRSAVHDALGRETL